MPLTSIYVHLHMCAHTHVTKKEKAKKGWEPDEKAQLVKGLATKLESLNLICGTHMIEGHI